MKYEMMDMIFDIKSKASVSFDVEDTFNEGNRLQGYKFVPRSTQEISNALGYGSLYIEKVNGRKCPQWVWATPKMHYPFNRDGVFKYPAGISNIWIYSKYDGSNLLSFSYIDRDLNQFVSYKTRKTAIVRDGPFGSFATMWREILEKYPKIPEMVLETGHNLAFEMYGKRNKHLVLYDVPLEARLLFGRDMNGVIKPPIGFNLEKYGIKGAELIETIDGNMNFVESYNRVVSWLNEHIHVEVRELQEDLVTGLEGSVWYSLVGDNKYKAKPDYVRDIHFATSAGIPKHSIYITCLNAFEDMDEPTLEYIIELLGEEFTEQEIYKKIQTVSRIFDDVWARARIKKKLCDEYKSHSEFDINKDKGIVMRHFSGLYSRKQMKMVYTLLMEEFGDGK